MRLKLTDLAIRKLPFPEKGQVKYWDTSTPGFGLLVSQRSKSFITMSGKERRLRTLGRHPEKSLSEARREAKRLLSRPIASSRSATHQEASQAFLDECSAKNRPKTIENYRLFLKKLDFDGKVSDITRQHLAPFLSNSHILTAFKVYLNWCLRNDLIDRNPIVGDRAPQNHHRTRVLSPDELKAIWQYEFPPYSDVLKLCILTGQRRGELAATIEGWITEDTLTFPSGITKNKRVHTIPITEWGRQYLPVNGYNGWSKAKARIDRYVHISHWTVHDLRRTFSTINAEIGTPLHVTEKILNHVSGSRSSIQQVYDQYSYMKDMRLALENYEAHLRHIFP